MTNPYRVLFAMFRQTAVPAIARRCLLLSFACFPLSAWAHHPLEGVPMQYFWHGLFSGIAHPLLGVDHLFFILALVATSLYSSAPLRTLGVVIAGVMTGVALVVSGVVIPWAETSIAISLICLGLVLLLQRPINNRLLLVIAGAFSVFHGCAYGQVLAAQDSLPNPVLAGFVAGLPLIYGVAALALSRLLVRVRAYPRLIHGIGALVALTGVVGLVSG